MNNKAEVGAGALLLRVGQKDIADFVFGTVLGEASHHIVRTLKQSHGKAHVEKKELASGNLPAT